MLKNAEKQVQQQVALHPEGVDRNQASGGKSVIEYTVALHPEGVDRNLDTYERPADPEGRPPPGGRG